MNLNPSIFFLPTRLVQLLILTYIVGWVIVYQKGYQQFEQVESAVNTKLKGVAYTNFTDEELVGVPKEWKHLYRQEESCGTDLFRCLFCGKSAGDNAN